MKKTAIVCLFIMAVVAGACTSPSRRTEIEQRKEALQKKQDSTLHATQAELALTDSALEVAKMNHDRLQQQLQTGTHSPSELQQLGRQITQARLLRDSLQVQYNVLCGKIRYIHHKTNKE